MKSCDVLIVGGGPSALTAAIYTIRAGLSTVVAAGGVEGVICPGGQLMLTTEVENYPGFLDVTGPELVHKMQEQAKKFGVVILDQWATDFQLVNGGPHRINVGPDPYQPKTVIFAQGAAAKWLGVPGEDKFRSAGISACATCDGPLPFYRKKHLYVIGGGDTAMEEALFLSKFASKTTVLYRGNKLRASKILQQRAADNPKIEIQYNKSLIEFKGETKLTTILIQDNVSQQVEEVDCAGVFIAIGHSPNTKGLESLGLLDEEGYIKTSNNVFTGIEGVFACGDVSDKVYRQAITAAGFGCMAALSAQHFLETHAKL